MRPSPLHLAATAALAAGFFSSRALAVNAFNFTVNQTSSTLTYNFSASAPVAGTMIGQNDPMQVATAQTRTKHMANILQCGTFTATTNEAINISGTVAASGSSPSPSNIHPGGTFKLGIDTASNTAILQDFNVNLVAGGPINTNANLNNFTYQSFCTVNPSCTAPFLVSVSLPLGTVSITSLVVAQDAGVPASGSLSANGANTWNFSVTTNVTVTPTVSFSGNALAADPQVIPMTIAGTVTVSGATASITASAQINYNPPANTTPTPEPPTPFSVPSTSTICPGINLILTLTVNSTTVSNTSTANVAATGTRLACRCDTNNSGGLEVQDIFDFLNLWFAGDARADFNGGGITVQDIFDFLSCWFARPLGC